MEFTVEWNLPPNVIYHIMEFTIKWNLTIELHQTQHGIHQTGIHHKMEFTIKWN